MLGPHTPEHIGRHQHDNDNPNPDITFPTSESPPTIPITIIHSPPVVSDSEDDDVPRNNNNNNKTRSVRFRSRVRITSGVHIQRPKTRRLSIESISSSSSPSSSISAPLRSPQDEGSWGPLGRRVSLLRRGGFGGRVGNAKRELPSNWKTPPTTNENAPLLLPQSSHRRSYHTEQEYQSSDEEEEEEETRLNREIDVVFGKWPARLLNRHVRLPYSPSPSYYILASLFSRLP